MNVKTYLFISAALFAAVAVIHLARAILAVPVHVGEDDLPVWLSYAGALVAAALALWGFRLVGRDAP